MRHAVLSLCLLIGCSGPQRGDSMANRNVDRGLGSAEDVDDVSDDDGGRGVDDDADGVLDVDDLCPHEPEDADGWEDIDGCPDLDNDADGFLDADDRCPLDPETPNGEADGCPDPAVDFILD